MQSDDYILNVSFLSLEIIGGDTMENNEKKNSDARIRANNKYKNAHYKRVGIDVKPEEAQYIKDTAKKYDMSIAQLILNAVKEFDINHDSNEY